MSHSLGTADELARRGVFGWPICSGAFRRFSRWHLIQTGSAHLLYLIRDRQSQCVVSLMETVL